MKDIKKRKKLNMKRIIGIVTVALVLVACRNAGAQGKVQKSEQDKTLDLNELAKECRRLKSCGESRKAADAAIEYQERGGTDSLEVAVDAMLKEMDYSDAVATDGSCRQFALHYLGKDKDALEWQNSVITVSPENPDVYFEKARLCSLAGFPDEAVSAMKTACEHGFNRFNIIERTDDLDNVRDIPAFKSLVETYSARHKAETERIRKEIRDLFQPSNQQTNQQS